MADPKANIKTVMVPGVGEVEVPETIDEAQPRTWSQRALDLVTNPEVVGGAAGALAKRAGGPVGMAAGAGMSLLNDYRHGDTDASGMAGRAVLHGGLNAIPFGIGAAVEHGLPAVGEAVGAMSADSGMLGTAMKGLQKLFGTALPKGVTPGVQAVASGGVARSPVATQIALLEQKLTDPRLNNQAKAAVWTAIQRLKSSQGMTMANRIRGILGLASAGTDQVVTP